MRSELKRILTLDGTTEELEALMEAEMKFTA
jgi:hypothetical protein